MQSMSHKVFDDYFASQPVRSVAKGELMHAPGEVPEFIHYIDSGNVKLYALSPEGDEKLLIVLMPGEMFSLTSTLLNLPTSFYAEAVMDSELRMVPRQEFLKFVRHDVARMDGLVNVLLKNMVVLNRRVLTLSMTRAYDRLITRLAILAESFGVEQPDGSIKIESHLTHQEIGNSINLSRESTSKEMHRLQERGLLEYSNGAVVILKPDALQNLIP